MMKDNDMKINYNYRFLSKIIFEADTPLAIGTGDKDIITDALVLTDVNGLPYIPGTTLAGVIRHAFGKDADSFFGFQEEKNGEGSKIIFTDARMIGKEGIAIEQIKEIPWQDDFYKHFKNLPIRQHARINDKGVTSDTGKFDEQIVFKGTRFCFEIEMLSCTEESKDVFFRILTILQSETFRLGSGTRCGFGSIKIADCKTAILNLLNSCDLTAYLDKTSSLADNQFWLRYNSENRSRQHNDQWIKYELHLVPDDFFLFGSGFGDEEADMVPVASTFIEWDQNDIPSFKEKNILMPASSIKGALAHRVAFYYNKRNQIFAEDIKDAEAKVGSKNKAIFDLFGSEDPDSPKRGNVIFSDVIEEPLQQTKEKILNHVKIDRFTGGAINGALFSEKAVYGNEQSFIIRILVNSEAFINENVKESFEEALNDICTGMLPLGGGVNRGNGIFSGKLLKEGEAICVK